MRFLSAYTFERRGLVGAALLRVGLASIMAVSYLWHVTTRNAIWGANGQLDFADYLQFYHPNFIALYKYSASHWYSDTIFCACILVAVAYALGIAPRVTCWLFAVTTFASYDRNTPAMDAGQALLVLLSFLLCFVDTSQYFSTFRRKASSRKIKLLAIYATMLHNSGRMLIAWQVCMVYYWSSFYKLGGDEWRRGTAMYYTMHLERFSWFPSIAHAISANAVVVAALTYGTLAFQGIFPIVMWNQRSKPYFIVIGIMLHGSIAIFMGLVSFSLTMIVADLSLLSDQQFIMLTRRGQLFFMRFLSSISRYLEPVLRPRASLNSKIIEIEE